MAGQSSMGPDMMQVVDLPSIPMMAPVAPTMDKGSIAPARVLTTKTSVPHFMRQEI